MGPKSCCFIALYNDGDSLLLIFFHCIFCRFERAIRAIISKTHPERQTCLFSATWPEVIRELAKDFLNNPVRVSLIVWKSSGLGSLLREHH